MSKNHRGRPLRRETPKSGRGTCPVSKRSGVKLLYEYEIEGQKLHISKAARAMLENKRKREERSSRRAELSAAAKNPKQAEAPEAREKPVQSESTKDSLEANREGSQSPPPLAQESAPQKEATQ